MVNFYLDSRTDKRGDAPIRCSISMKGVRLVTSIGYSIKPDAWNKEKQVVRKGFSNGKGIPYNVINGTLNKVSSRFSELECEKSDINKERIQNELAIILGKKEKGDDSSNKTLEECIEEYSIYKNNIWTLNTKGAFKTFKNHLYKWKGTPTFDDFNEEGLNSFVNYLRYIVNLKESSIFIHISHLSWFLNWCTIKGYYNGEDYKHFVAVPRSMKKGKDRIIFLTWEQIMKIREHIIPEGNSSLILKNETGTAEREIMTNKGQLEIVRDLFLFSCFTGLRYSDMHNLKKGNVKEDCIELVTIKTNSSLTIELNDYSREILNKYIHSNRYGDFVFPRILNYRMNDYLKLLGYQVGLNEITSYTIYKGGKRLDISAPLWSLITCHVGRKTFISNALMMGIPATVVMSWTGHRDFNAMKPYIAIANSAKKEAMSLFNKK